VTSPPSTLPDRLLARAQATPECAAWFHLDASEAWQTSSWKSVAEQVGTLATSLARLGLQRGDHVAIMLPSSPQWDCCQHAVLACGAVVVGLDAHDAHGTLQHILSVSRPRAIIATSAETLITLQGLYQEADILIHARGAPHTGQHSLASLMEPQPGAPPAPNQARPDDTATIVFTSGSTGLPKGIPYSHRQLLLACDALATHFPTIRQDARMVCWLPLANLFQRILNMFSLSYGARTYFVEQPDQIIRWLPEIKPTLFVGVPRFFEKLHANIVAELERAPPPARLIAYTAWRIGERIATAKRNGLPPHLRDRLLAPLASRVLTRLRSLMGADLQFMASGSAPLPVWLMERFHGLGWLVLEAYGVSENVIPIAINTPKAYRFGSVGRTLPGNELVIADDHELLVRGPGVSSSYIGHSPASPPCDQIGFLHTGDFARIDEDGFVWLEGRKSEVFKTSTGRRIAPVPIEASLKKIPLVEHAIIVGRDRPYPVAILCVSPQHPVALQCGGSGALEQLRTAVVASCAELAGYQRPGAVIVSTHALSTARGELTANLKLRRSVIETHFSAQIETAYRASSDKQAASPFILTDL